MKQQEQKQDDIKQILSDLEKYEATLKPELKKKDPQVSNSVSWPGFIWNTAWNTATWVGVSTGLVSPYTDTEKYDVLLKFKGIVEFKTSQGMGMSKKELNILREKGSPLAALYERAKKIQELKGQLFEEILTPSTTLLSP